MYLKIIVITLLISSCVLGSNIASAGEFRVIAMVNGQPISNHKLNSRIKIMLVGLNQAYTEENIQKISNRALQTLINESLQKQSAVKIGLAVKDEEVKRAMNVVEQKNGLKIGGLPGFVKGQGLSMNQVKKQIKAQILWQKILANKIQPSVKISDFEVDDYMKSQNISGKKTEVYLSEIIISGADSAKKLSNVQSELQEGLKFSDAAKKFSNSQNSSDGGVIGWVDEGQLMEPLRQDVVAAKANTILNPIVSEDGYRIIKIGNKRMIDGAANRTKYYNLLFNKQMQLAAKSYMEKLRSNAIIVMK